MNDQINEQNGGKDAATETGCIAEGTTDSSVVQGGEVPDSIAGDVANLYSPYSRIINVKAENLHIHGALDEDTVDLLRSIMGVAEDCKCESGDSES
jgi:hypothetical protein